MDENLHNIEDLFHSALDDNDETPSQNVWDIVDKRLDKDNIVSIKRKYTNLKRIAILLLFLLVSFVLFDVYKTNTLPKGDNFAKNDDGIKSDKQTKANTTRGTDSEKNTETNSFVITDTSNNIDTKKDEPSLENVTANNQKLINQQQDVPFYNTQLKRRNKVEKIYPSKSIKENPEDLTSDHKKKRNTKGSYRIKITNPNPVEDRESADQNDYTNNQIPYLPKQNTRLLEGDKLKAKDSTDTKKISTLIVSAKPKAADSSNNSIAKTASKKTSKPSRFSFTPFFSPDIAWYRLQDDKKGQPDNASEIGKEERHEFSYTYGVLADYKINKHWGLQSGVTLSNTNITVEPKTIYAQRDNTGSVKYRINTSSGYGYVLPSFSSNPAIGDSLYAFTSTHSLQYIGIPLAITYNIKKGKFKFNALAGIAANILTKAKLEATLEKGFNNSIETLDNIRGLKKVYFSGLAGIGVDYKLTKKTSLVFAPTMRFALNSINKDAPVKSYPMAFGLSVGLKIEL